MWNASCSGDVATLGPIMLISASVVSAVAALQSTQIVAFIPRQTFSIQMTNGGILGHWYDESCTERH